MPIINETNIDINNPEHSTMLNDLQGNILKNNGREHAVHLFFRFKEGSAEQARKWIEKFSILVTSASEQIIQTKRYNALANQGEEKNTSGEIFINFLLSAEGYRFLGCPEEKLPKDERFKQGVFGLKKVKNNDGAEQHKNLQEILNDPAINQWEKPFQKPIHAAILLGHDDKNDLMKMTNHLLNEIKTFIEFSHIEFGDNIRDNKCFSIEHFGYVDGVSQPLFLKDMIEKDKVEQGNHSNWSSNANLDLVLVDDVNGDFEHSFGTYVVYRKLEQDVEGFRNAEQKLADHLGVDKELAGALTVGRFKDGAPVTKFFNAQNTCPVENNFNYSDDPNGVRCPFQAHIRKTNPRLESAEKLPKLGIPVTNEEELAHRIARRGIPYGKQGTKPVGLLFICLQSNISNQFEFMQETWANNHNFVQPGPDFNQPGPEAGLDAVIGQGFARQGQAWPKKWGEENQVKEKFDFSNFVTMRGGEYFFMPSISLLKTIDKKFTDKPELAPAPANARRCVIL